LSLCTKKDHIARKPSTIKELGSSSASQFFIGCYSYYLKCSFFNGLYKLEESYQDFHAAVALLPRLSHGVLGDLKRFAARSPETAILGRRT